MNREEEQPQSHEVSPISDADLHRIQHEISSIADSIIAELDTASRADSKDSKAESKADSLLGDVRGRPKRRKKKKKRKDCIEVDFYNNPTILSRLVLYQKYESAIDRLRRCPEEAQVWVAAIRDESSRRSPSPQRLASAARKVSTRKYSVRQLPLHIAVMNLRRTLDPRSRASLNKLITNLAVAYPDGAREVDHLGNLALHQAISNNVAAETLSMLLMAYPESCQALDSMGRNNQEILRYGSSEAKKQVQEILELPQSFWESAREEARLRLKQERVSWPGDTDSVESERVLASSTTSAESIETMPGEEPKQKPKMESDEIEAIGWEQLEERAMALEQILSEVNESNYYLNQRIEALSKSKLQLIDTLDRVKKTDLAARQLQRENKKLRAKVEAMQEILKDSSGSEGGGVRKRSREGASLRQQADAHRKLNEAHQKLKQHYTELSASYQAQRHQLMRLEEVVKVLLANEETPPKPTGADPSVGKSIVSSLSEDSFTFDSGRDTFALLKPKPLEAIDEPPLESSVEIEWTPQLVVDPVVGELLSASLSTILRRAAASEQRTSPRHLVPSPVSRPPSRRGPTTPRELCIPALIVDTGEYEPVDQVGADRTGFVSEGQLPI